MNAVPILLYHSVADHAARRDLPFTVTPATLAGHLRVLDERGATTLTVSDLAERFRLGAQVEPGTVVVTVDDAYADTAEVLAPALAAIGMTATVYVSTATIGSTVRDSRMISWAQVRELVDAGLEVGSHGHRHVPLDLLRGATVLAELTTSRALLQDWLGDDVSTFAYPYGFHTPAVEHLVAEAGFRSACAVKNALSHPGDDVYALARVTVTRDTGAEDLAALLDSLLQSPTLPLSTARRRVKTRVWRGAREALRLAHIDIPGAS